MNTNTVYHVYNQSNGNEKLFREEENYRYFIRKMKHYLLPVCDIYAYCLMPYHFHIMVKIKTSRELHTLWNPGFKRNPSPAVLRKRISKVFASLFSSYALSYNKAYFRSGSLFRPNMKTRQVKNSLSFKTLVHFIHSNPVIHKECESVEEWKHSSVHHYFKQRQKWICREQVIQKFRGITELRRTHSEPLACRLKIY